MDVIRQHIALTRPRFRCRDVDETTLITVDLQHGQGRPASAKQLARLAQLSGDAYATLVPLYRENDGLIFHAHGDTAGLVVATIRELKKLNADWRKWFKDVPVEELYDYQRHGFAFATIHQSGNYFVAYQGRIYYSDHDDAPAEPWSANLTAFFERALGDPVRFLEDAGCYTRYSDGRTDKQFIPISFEHA
jgi:hypothetical protein